MANELTALMIQSRGVKINPYQDSHSGKWGYVVSGSYMPLLAISPVYDSKVVAQKEGEDFVDIIKNLDLPHRKKELCDLMGDTKEAVKSVIDASK